MSWIWTSLLVLFGLQVQGNLSMHCWKLDFFAKFCILLQKEKLILKKYSLLRTKMVFHVSSSWDKFIKLFILICLEMLRIWVIFDFAWIFSLKDDILFIISLKTSGSGIYQSRNGFKTRITLWRIDFST